VLWAPHFLNKRSRIIASVTKRYHKRTHKFGIEVPKSWDECVRLDKEKDNTLWQDAVRKEINNFIISLKIINGEESVPPTYQEICCHMIFDIKMEDSQYLDALSIDHQHDQNQQTSGCKPPFHGKQEHQKEAFPSHHHTWTSNKF
jgi:hypothetical protein